MPDVSIILPTLNERRNIETLLPQLVEQKDVLEVLVVDDASRDGTADYAESIGHRKPVRAIRRPGKLGLASAIVRGMSESRGLYLIVMDADCSHDPSVIPAMVRELEKGTDVVVGSRYVEGGGIVGWPLYRQVMSRVATRVAKILLRVSEKDPMSGYFGLRREVYEHLRPVLQPRGYKILLEILVRGRPLTTKEIGFIFHDREHGKSKISGTIAWEYGRMLLELLFRRKP